MRRTHVGEGVNMRPSPCPVCGRVLDAASMVGGEGRPKPGDFTVCMYCSSILRFDGNLSLRQPGDRALIMAQRSEVWPLLERVQRAARAVREESGDFTKRQ